MRSHAASVFVALPSREVASAMAAGGSQWRSGKRGRQRGKGEIRGVESGAGSYDNRGRKRIFVGKRKTTGVKPGRGETWQGRNLEPETWQRGRKEGKKQEGGRT